MKLFFQGLLTWKVSFKKLCEGLELLSPINVLLYIESFFSGNITKPRDTTTETPSNHIFNWVDKLSNNGVVTTLELLLFKQLL